MTSENATRRARSSGNGGNGFGRLELICGLSGAGKTRYCLQLVERARSSGLVVAGFISEPVYERGIPHAFGQSDGRKSGIELVNQITGERRLVAFRRSLGGRGLFTENWQFDRKVLQWADGQLKRLPGCQRLVIDELGPLEFERGEGLQNAFELLDRRKIPLIWVSIRPRLLSAALARWPWATVTQLG